MPRPMTPVSRFRAIPLTRLPPPSSPMAKAMGPTRLTQPRATRPIRPKPIPRRGRPTLGPRPFPPRRPSRFPLRRARAGPIPLIPPITPGQGLRRRKNTLWAWSCFCGWPGCWPWRLWWARRSTLQPTWATPAPCPTPSRKSPRLPARSRRRRSPPPRPSPPPMWT